MRARFETCTSSLKLYVYTTLFGMSLVDRCVYITHIYIGIAAGYGLYGPRMNSRQRQASIPALGPALSPLQRVSKELSPIEKRLGRKANHSPSSSAEIKKGEPYIHSPIRLHGMVLN
jgi:hypothetical protein